jgi:translocator protein
MPENYNWYSSLVKSKLTPPSWVFGPAWTILYVLIGIAFWKIWENRQKPYFKPALCLFGLHLIANFAWSNIFFKQQNIKLALYDLIFLWASLIVIMVMTSKIKTVTLLLLPYLTWLTYALFLNFRIFQLN